MLKDRIVTVESGTLRGLHGWDTRVIAFKGIPYAAPPVGALRWKAPEPPASWEGIRDAFEYGNISVQPQPGKNPEDFWSREIHPTGTEFSMSEDCLYLNVFTSARSEQERLPVLFYIHGGGYKGGYPQEIEFNWEQVAKKGVVAVAVTYRLGVMGFFAHPQLSEESPEECKGNFGLQDQLAALRWVKRNIAAFGGDPDRITIAGQSAGAGSVQALLTSPYVEEGLIKGAIIESGITIDMGDLDSFMQPAALEEAYQNGERLLALADVHSVEEARKIPAEKLVEIEDTKMGPGFHFQPTLDGIFLTETPGKACAAGRMKNVPVLAGYNRGETESFIRMFLQTPESMDTFEAFLMRYGEKADRFRALADVRTDEDVKRLFERDAMADLIAGTRLFGSMRDKYGQKAYLYEFDPEIPGEDHPGSYHGSEMWFAYASLERCWRPFKGVHYDLERQVNGYWTNFVKTGSPNGCDWTGEKLPVWDAFSEENPFVMRFTDHPAPSDQEIDDLMRFRMEFAWERLSEGKH